MLAYGHKIEKAVLYDLLSRNGDPPWNGVYPRTREHLGLQNMQVGHQMSIRSFTFDGIVDVGIYNYSLIFSCVDLSIQQLMHRFGNVN